MDREKPVSCGFFFFFFLVDAEKNLGISLSRDDDDDDDDDILIINKNSAISEKILHLSFLSLSLLII